MPDTGFHSIGIAVGLPFCGRPTHPLWGVALASQSFPLNTTATHVVVQNREVGEARNEIVDFALKNNATYIFFLDDDVILPPFAVQRLGYLLDTRGPKLFPDSKVAVACGIYFSKEELTTPVVYKQNGEGGYWNWKLEEIFEVASAGTGCMMIRADVFRHLEKPYFKTVDDYIKLPDGQVGMQRMTDDIFFCKKVTEAGYTILAHGGVICGHYDVSKDKIYTLPDDSYPVMAAKEAEALALRVPADEATTETKPTD